MIPLAAFGEREKGALAALEPRRQTAYAAACVERLFPAYEAFRAAAGTDPEGLVRQAIDLAWAGAEGDAPGAPEAGRLVERLLGLLPGPDEVTVVPAQVEDAVIAAAYAVQGAAGLEPEAARWAAAHGTDALDAFLLDTVIDFSDPDADEKVWRHQLVQAEVACREADLARLRGPDWEAHLPAIRREAAASSSLSLDQ